MNLLFHGTNDAIECGCNIGEVCNSTSYYKSSLLTIWISSCTLANSLRQ
ncbi:hypothetical protein HanRHA438_Chr12g0574921 [Helianthus annuus]|nr:hypothetical protein HanRHA438_Chr12g0574921 [Helianthus annuus]